MIKKVVVLLVITLCFVGCKDENEVEKEIAKIPVKFQVERFDKKFAEADIKDLPHLKKEYPFLFPPQYPDSLWLAKMNDTIQLEINKEVAQKFPNFDKEKENIKELFQHLKFYFPQFKTPRVITLTSEVDYTNKVVLADSLLLISLDTYLGEEHKFYKGIAEYIHNNFRPAQIAPDIATQYAEQYIPRNKSRTLLASMVYYGKILYIKDKLLPDINDAEKIGYTEDEMQWAEDNEQQIWRYFIEHELLFKTDTELQKRFINLAPFTKFNLQLDNQSPPQLGQFIGWQIVRQFMKKNEKITLPQLLNIDAETIFNKSNYKPRRP